MAETKPKDEAQVIETPQEGRTKSELAAALIERANMQAEWNTKSDHPKGREAHELAALLEGRGIVRPCAHQGLGANE